MALSEFMPYGAPELLDGARGRMARSTFLAGFAVAALVAGLGAFVARDATPAIEIAPVVDASEWLPPLAPPAPPAPRVEPPAEPRSVPGALPVPVPDSVTSANEPADALPAAGGPRGSGEPDASRAADGLSIGSALVRDPEPTDVIVVDELPALVSCPDARYPDLARAAGVEGMVRVLMLVGLDGRVQRVQVAPGGSVPTLDEAALAAARGCLFTPALSGGHPVKVWVSRGYRFTLH